MGLQALFVYTALPHAEIRMRGDAVPNMTVVSRRSPRALCHLHGVMYLTGKTQAPSRRCWKDAGLPGAHQLLAGPGQPSISEDDGHLKPLLEAMGEEEEEANR